MKTLAFLIAALVAATTALADAQERRITVTGTGSAEAAPDMATITLGVTNQDTEAAAAMWATSEVVAQILTRLEQMGVEPRDVQTRDLSVSPVWNRNPEKEDEAPKITGFVASNRVFVRLRDLDQLGEVLDAVIRDGANEFGGLSFGVLDPEPLAATARAEAVADAMAKAQQLAEAAGLKLGKVISIDEHGAVGRPMMRMSEMAMADAGSVPVAAGEIAVEASVSMVFEIAE
ncbi:DUF541 domain-containing protein [Ruegeria sediminis]|uniref:DUF541 domain-containing protein n=1 Tax=Ruegeria sediminis TaxID=2583820 RepID=A0ABY2X1Y7_9RHOB|nr:SIMPL domain-containing protein [Ruegeria sediminis]TMV08987.1 DUF541 domain-containing protein [Ruegeria sediminis]